MYTSFWTAFGAIAQALCAVATFTAVLVALKPYKKKVVVYLRRLSIKFGDGKTTIPMGIQVKNDGAKPISIIAAGVKEKYEIIYHEGVYDIEEDGGIYGFSLSQQQLLEAFKDEKVDFFSVFVRDNKGNTYYSSQYRKKEFVDNSEIMEAFS